MRLKLSNVAVALHVFAATTDMQGHDPISHPGDSPKVRIIGVM